MSAKEELMKIVIDHPELFDVLKALALDLLESQHSLALVDQR